MGLGHGGQGLRHDVGDTAQSMPNDQSLGDKFPSFFSQSGMDDIAVHSREWMHWKAAWLYRSVEVEAP